MGGGGWARPKRTTSYKVINTTDTWKKSQKPFTRCLLKKKQVQICTNKKGLTELYSNRGNILLSDAIAC